MDGLYISAQTQPAQPQAPASKASASSSTDRFQRLLDEAQPTSAVQPGKAEVTNENLVALGRLNRAAPTVSHLLVQNPATREQVWDIVHSQANQTKDFRHITTGETIYLDTATQEIVWGQEVPSHATAVAAPSSLPEEHPSASPPALAGAPDQAPPQAATPASTQPEQSKPASAASLFRAAGAERFLAAAFDFSEPYTAQATQHAGSSQTLPELNQAVAAYCGNSYNQMDCYELVVQGLKDLGVDYGGREGLQQALMAKAEQEGRPSNAYLTGEGLISASGRHVYQAAFHPPEDPQAKADALFAELSGNLEPGMVLSFSTPNRGHTGVIGKQGQAWTFINSGVIDNPVGQAGTEYGVAEEDLRKELANWLRRSAADGQTLQVSVGVLDPGKLAAFQAGRGIEERV
ncbi:hypothetical protein [Desulfohalobium retbaense]|uniref:Uncharacterized protein n=1 Tax=Desulfohalobium retbaense (strain ATCC 49708 / DSM 5692 / JCM 16813 / HR100) TaxID=485915 RepID=C8WYY7_DESRD|nr:hypothetical protein [Desulfohalobium retbaense]ACV67903.1 conserved hypothetical protein [Desulfohalobium retbaense DSM 5692]